MVTNPELDELDLSSVIDAVKSASADELAKLTEISSKLDNAPARTGVPIVQTELDTSKFESAVKNGVESATLAVNKKKKRKSSRRNRPVGQTNTRTNEVELDLSTPEVATQSHLVPAPINRIADNPELETQQEKPEEKERFNTLERADDLTVSVDPSLALFEHANPLDGMPEKVEQAVKDGLSGFDGRLKGTVGKDERLGHHTSDVVNQAQLMPLPVNRISVTPELDPKQEKPDYQTAAVANQSYLMPAPVNRIADNPELDPKQGKPEGKERDQPAVKIGDVTVSVDTEPALFDQSKPLNDVPEKLEQAVKDGLSAFDGYWKDAAGRLHRKDGKYASKQETQAYSAAEVAQQRQQEQIANNNQKQAGLFAQFSSTLKDFTNDYVKTSVTQDNDATDAAGAAAGGSFFYSAKEIYNLSQEAKDTFSEAKKSVTNSGARDAIATSKIGKLFSFKSSAEKSESDRVKNTTNEKAESATVSTDASRTESIKSASETDKQSNNHGLVNSHSNQSDTDVKHSSRSVQEVTNNERTTATDATIANVEYTDSRALVSHSSVRDSESISTTASDKSSSERVAQSQVATQTSSTSRIDRVKDSQYKAEHLEVLKEQTTERKDMVSQIVDKLDEVKKAAASSGGGSGGGLMDLVGDLFDRKGKGRKRGRGGKSGKLGSIFSKGSGAASKGMSMAGGAFKGLSKVAGIAGKAVPFLAPALMAYDAFSGFTDTEKQKETFNLKDGQQASTGQKSSMALASVLDMGGLVSGGAGLLGGVLGSLGFDGAEKALSFDSGDIARGIYNTFSSDSAEKEKTTKPPKIDLEKEREYSVDALEYKQSSKLEREAMESKADPQFLTTEQVKERSAETGKSYGETYKLMSRERDKQNQARQIVADEMGVDISGQVEHPELGTMYSPKKKSDQLKVIEKELSRRREVESLARQDDFRNGRFISSESKGYISSMNTKLSEETQRKSNNQSAVDAQDSSLTTEVMTPVVANAESKVQGNERVSDIRNQQQDKAFRKGDKPQSVKLDDETIKKLSGGTSSQTSTTIIQKGDKTKEAKAPAKPTGSIPNNFSDRSLQRQSADLE
ncbi:hypothetical protein [Vibrio metschnikovii]|uniref:hypothetical protein n=1 Tax=Vibrio metschnikovii TaxID=28172 RepID=UPI001C2F96B2|nr:hypothetical protein [Vibrio metschnikovii]